VSFYKTPPCAGFLYNWNMKKLRIGIDCQYLLSNFPAGPERYMECLISALSEIDSINEYVLFFKKTPEPEFFSKLTRSVPNFNFKVISSSVSWTQCGLALELLKNPVDVFFSPFHTLPFLAVRRLSRLKRTQCISMIHGLEYDYEHKNRLKGCRLNFLLKNTVKYSDRVLVPAEHTKKALLKKAWVKDESKIVVIPEGVAPQFKKYPLDEVLPVLEKYSLDKVPYLIFISTIQPRKNVPNLIGGFARALETEGIPKDTKLILVGKNGWDYEKSLEAPEKYNVTENVVFTGRIPDEDLAHLLSGARVYVSVSFEEGFGLPLLEAMSSKVPCVISDIPSYRDLAKENAIYVDSKSIESISAGICEALNSPNGNIEKAYERSQKYSWRTTARKTLEVFQGEITK